MSKMKELDGMLTDLVMSLITPMMVEYTAEADVDVIAVFFPESKDGNKAPAVIIPNSERAKTLFLGWGMDEKCIGIAPPEDAMDLINSVPIDWVMASQDIKEGAHIIHEITLPRPLPVVH